MKFPTLLAMTTILATPCLAQDRDHTRPSILFLPAAKPPGAAAAARSLANMRVCQGRPVFTVMSDTLS